MTLRASDLEKMRAYAAVGGVFSHDEALELLALSERFLEALKDIHASSGRAKVLAIMSDVLSNGEQLSQPEMASRIK